MVAGHVHLSWSPATLSSGAAVTGYYATRDGGLATSCGSASSLVATTNCDDTTATTGTHTYVVVAVFRSWTATSAVTSIAVDTTPPSIAAVVTPTPNANGWVRVNPATVTLTATDTGGSGVASITWWVDAGSHTTTAGTSVGASVTGNGIHTVSAFATDAAGNVGATVPTAVRIDTVAPTVAATASTSPITNPTKAATSVSGTVETGATVTVSASDGTTTTAPVTATVLASTWSAALDVSGLADGTITFTATATDAAGNTATATRTSLKNTTDTFALSGQASATAGSATLWTITAKTVTGATDTTYAGTKTVTFSGPGTSPIGTGPSYPGSVTFTAGVASPVSITLFKAESIALTATQGSIAGTSTTVTVSAATPTKLSWGFTLPGGASWSTPCTPESITCVINAFGSNVTATGSVSALDAYDNLAQNVGKAITLAATNGSFAPPTTPSFPASGAATIAFSYTSRNGNGWSSASLTATGSAGQSWSPVVSAPPITLNRQ